MYTMFVTNNYASFYLWWKGNLVKHQKVSKYYDMIVEVTKYSKPIYHHTPQRNTDKTEISKLKQISYIFLILKLGKRVKISKYKSTFTKN